MLNENLHSQVTQPKYTLWHGMSKITKFSNWSNLFKIGGPYHLCVCNHCTKLNNVECKLLQLLSLSVFLMKAVPRYVLTTWGIGINMVLYLKLLFFVTYLPIVKFEYCYLAITIFLSIVSELDQSWVTDNLL